MNIKKIGIALIVFLASLLLPFSINASPSNNPIFATLQQVQEIISGALSTVNSDINAHQARIDELENQVEDLEIRMNQLEATPAPTRGSLQVDGVWNTNMDIPSGYKSMTISVVSAQSVGDWAPNPSFDSGSTFWEQIRFGCNGAQSCQLLHIPILSNKYKFTSGGGTDPNLVDINLTLYPEATSEVLILGSAVNYPFTSADFNSASFNTITVTIGGGDNPQNLTGVFLDKLAGVSYAQVASTSCDGGAICPMVTHALANDSVYRVRVTGNGTKAVVGAILRN